MSAHALVAAVRAGCHTPHRWTRRIKVRRAELAAHAENADRDQLAELRAAKAALRQDRAWRTYTQVVQP